MDKRDSSVRGFLMARLAMLFKSGPPATPERTRSVRRQIQKLEVNQGKASKSIRLRRRRDQIAKASRRRNRAA